MSDQLTLSERLWEVGYDSCVRFRGVCRFRPCTAAQGVLCCRECFNYEACSSKCRKGIRDGRKGSNYSGTTPRDR